MASVTHTFVSAIADDAVAAAAGEVLPSHWNAGHTVSLVAADMVPAGTTTKIQYNLAGALAASGATTDATGNVTVPSGAKLHLNAADTVVAVDFGGTTASFPALRRNGAVLQAILANASAYANFDAANITAQGGGRLFGSNADSTAYSQWILDASPYSGIRFAAGNGVWWTATAAATGSAAIGTPILGVTRNSNGVAEVNNGTAGSYTGTALVLGSQTVAQLPAAAAGIKGARATVTDATTTTFMGALTGGGANIVPVFCNGSAWVIG